MSGIVIEDEAWRRIMADERLQHARSRLSFHEIRLIVQHVRDSAIIPYHWGITHGVDESEVVAELSKLKRERDEIELLKARPEDLDCGK